MKKEVTVCDIEGCRHLADSICVLCKKDVCSTHSPGAVVVSITVEDPHTGSGSIVVNLRREYRATCCRNCQIETPPALSSGRSADEILAPFSATVIEFLQACAAASKLKRPS